MADVTVVAAKVRALEGAIIKQFKAGAAATMGDAVYIAADGDVEDADGNVTPLTARGVGVIAEVNEPGETTVVDGDAVSVVTFGPVAGFSGLTPGALLYVSATAGALADAAPTGAGTWTRVMGYAMSATVVFVAPGMVAPVSNS